MLTKNDLLLFAERLQKGIGSLLEVSKPKPRARGFYASEGKRLSNLRDLNTFKCSRKTYFDFTDWDKKAPFSDRAKENFRQGLRIENYLKSCYRKLGLEWYEHRKGYIYNSYYTRNEVLNCGGFPDEVLKLELNGTRNKVTDEIKTMDHFSFNRVVDKPNDIAYIMQLNFYLKQMNEEWGMFTFYNKNTGKILHLPYKYSEDIYKEMGEYFNYIQKYLDKGDPPPRDYDILVDVQCGYCPYFNLCFKIPSPPPPEVMNSQVTTKRKVTKEEREEMKDMLKEIGRIKTEMNNLQKDFENKKERIKEFLSSTGLQKISCPNAEATLSQRNYTKWNERKLEQILKSLDLWDLRSFSIDNKKIKKLIQIDGSLDRVIEPAKENTIREFLSIRAN